MAPSGSVKTVKAVYVGRHELLPAQKRALAELRLEIVKRIENLPTGSELNALFQQWKSEGIEAVVTVALPPSLLAQLSVFPLYVFQMESRAAAITVEEAQRWVEENPTARTFLPGRPGEPIRLLQFTGIQRVKVIIQSEKVWPVQ
jgi:hypothetical protein